MQFSSLFRDFNDTGAYTWQWELSPPGVRWGPCVANKKKRMNESSAVLKAIISKVIGMALETIYVQYSHEAHN